MGGGGDPGEIGFTGGFGAIIAKAAPATSLVGAVKSSQCAITFCCARGEGWESAWKIPARQEDEITAKTKGFIKKFKKNKIKK